MRTPKYMDAIEWIALNDDPGSQFALDWNEIKDQISIVLVADLFGVSNEIVAVAVCRYRKDHEVGL